MAARGGGLKITARNQGESEVAARGGGSEDNSEESGESGSGSQGGGSEDNREESGESGSGSQGGGPKITVKNQENPEVVAREVAPRIIVRNQEIPEGTDTGTPMASISLHGKSFALSSIATQSNAKRIGRSHKPRIRMREEVEEYEAYEYVRNPLEVSYEMDISMTQTDDPEEEGTALHASCIPLFSGDDDGDSIIAALPSFVDDDLEPIDVSGYGASGTILYTFKVWDHRTEGRIHINKRDLELLQCGPGMEVMV